MKKALFVAGGWNGHKPEQIVQLFISELTARGFACETSTALEVFGDLARLKAYDLIFPCWTMGQLTKEQTDGLVAAVREGVGLGGIHGGMGDAFRGNLDYEWMVGGHFVGHPHVGDYTVRRTHLEHPITATLPAEFAYKSEQYYMLIDPAVTVLAETTYVYENTPCAMPVAWVRRWGKGRVFYQALGHSPEEFSACPAAKDLTIRGLLWAAGCPL